MNGYGFRALLWAMVLALPGGENASAKLALITQVAFHDQAVVAWDHRFQELRTSDALVLQWSSRRLPFERLYGLACALPNTLLLLARFPNRAGPIRLLRSVDEGETWQPFGNGLPETLEVGYQSLWTNALVQHPHQPTRFSIVTEGTLWLSSDSGNSWHAEPAAELSNVLRCELRGKNGEILYAWRLNEDEHELVEILLSRDGGRSWHILGENVNGAHQWGPTCVLGVHPNDPARLIGYDVVDARAFEGTGTLALLSSSDFGSSWTVKRLGDARSLLRGSRGWHAPAEAEIAESFHYVQLLPDPKGPGLTFSNAYGVYRTGNALRVFPGSRVLAASAWQPILLLMRHPNMPELLVASSTSGFFLSRDSGRTWTHAHLSD